MTSQMSAMTAGARNTTLAMTSQMSAMTSFFHALGWHCLHGSQADSKSSDRHEDVTNSRYASPITNLEKISCSLAES